MKYTPEVKGRFIIISKSGTIDSFHWGIEAERDYLITHNFGAYELDDNTIIFDAITWDSEEAYTKWTFIDEMLTDGPGASNNITRFTIHLDKGTVDMELLHPQDDGTWIEFSQINWKYADEKQYYRYICLHYFDNMLLVIAYKTTFFWITFSILGMVMLHKMNLNFIMQ